MSMQSKVDQSGHIKAFIFILSEKNGKGKSLSAFCLDVLYMRNDQKYPLERFSVCGVTRDGTFNQVVVQVSKLQQHRGSMLTAASWVVLLLFVEKAHLLFVNSNVQHRQFLLVLQLWKTVCC